MAVDPSPTRSVTLLDAGMASDSGVTAPLVTRFQQEFHEQLGVEELRHYWRYEEQIRGSFEGRTPALAASTSREKDELQTAVADHRKAVSARRRSLFVVIPIALVAAASTLVAIGSFVGDFSNRDLLRVLPNLSRSLQLSQRLWLAVTLPLAVVAAVVCVRLYLAHSVRLGEAVLSERRARNEYDARVTTVVSEAVSLTINEVLAETGALLFPTRAPTLVELTSRAIVPSTTQRYVREFVASHQSSSIGIAGTRGSGKSTLLTAIRDDTSLAARTVAISAPVRYDSVDFTKRLLLECANEVLRKRPVPQRRTIPQRWGVRAAGRLRTEVAGLLRLGLQAVGRVRRARVRGAFLAILVGGFAFWFDYFYNPPRAEGTRLELLGLAGAVVFSWGATLLFTGTASVVLDEMTRPAEPSVAIATEVVRMLTWEIEQAQKSKNILKIVGGIVGLEDEDSLTMKRKSLSHPDLVAKFQDLLLQVSRESAPGEQFLICIDELDKLSTDQELIDAVNGLKDLFHIPGVHFVVSVSTDALMRFEQRGVPTRDAFDSSFDTIVPVERLTASESLKIVSSRAAGFPAGLALFCHAWSGGLPRDLLRAARRCVEVQRGSPQDPVPAARIVQEVVSGDLAAYLDSVTRTIDRGSSDVTALVRIANAVGRLRKTGEAPTSVLSEVSGIEGGDCVDRARALVSVGVALIELFSTVPQGETDWDAPGDPVWSSVAKFAKAVALQGQLPALRDIAISDAVAGIPPVPSTPPG